MLNMDKFKNTAAAQTAPQPAPAAASTNALEGLGSAQVFEKGIQFETGTYVATIDVVKLFPSRQKSADIFVVEFIVKETINGAAQPGERRSWVQQINKVGDVKQRPMALSAIKGFVMAAVNPKTPADKAAVADNAQEIILAAVSDSQDLKGYEVRVASSPIPPKKPGDPVYQRVNFTGV